MPFSHRQDVGTSASYGQTVIGGKKELRLRRKASKQTEV